MKTEIETENILGKMGTERSSLRRNNMYYIDDTHKNAYMYFLERDGAYEDDVERKALFYILASNDKLRYDIEKLYDFDERAIRIENFENENYYSSGENKLIEAAYNLYNGYGCNTIINIFGGLDNNYFEVLIRALRIRFKY